MLKMEDSIAFNAEWFDKLACANRQYKFLFYPYDQSIEIIDIKMRKQHLKRIKFDVSESDLFIGA